MADTTTELEVLDEIVDVLGGQSGQYETVVPTLQQILALLGGGGGGGGGGYNPALSVGRADALTGADSTAQWAQRDSTGSGAATVRSVQGATEVQDGELVPVQIAGIRSTDAQGNALDNVEWEAQTLWGAGAIGDMLYADHKETKVGVVDLGTLSWASTTQAAGTAYRAQVAGRANGASNLKCAQHEVGSAPMTLTDGQIIGGAGSTYVYIRMDSCADVQALVAAIGGQLLAYELATPTTTPISPALSMTYRVQQGGGESIIVPTAEISAIPVLTIAEGESVDDVVMDALACIATPDGPVATANHALNTYLTMGGKLYKVTSAIAAGETITPNTNVTETTVMAELLALTA